ncbi:acyl-CoA dehydrogenase family protein [Spectribacter hydrogenooxidans]|uniref:Acyl-CoA dehydrogenase family protein n=1 Tax=Spectribacter hydrogenoxidans TaxID=3075608 RepID=A0ABU3C3Z8_9GAMM|nr:acyl-CoA dehydrogenase family protein [Salinisphaera sp. W335]MDT0636265.1 acyl-CoA dehydrogenase family protein [Salinisphaera sp. W335]
MDFELSEDQRAYREAAATFAASELAPNAAEWDAESHFPKDVISAAGELGFCGLYSPEEAGGLGLSRLDSSIVFEALAGGCTSTTAFMTIHNMATWMVTAFGNEELVGEWGEELTSGRKLASYCLTEAGAGSDAAKLKTTAKRDGDDYVLNGGKVFSSGAGDTEALVVMARTGGDGAGGISCFLVPGDADGVSYGKKEEKLGWNCQPTRAINFDDARIPARYRVGEEGEGFKFAMKGLDGGRINIATCSVGTAQAAMETTRNYMAERSQFGNRLNQFQALQFKFADMATDLVAARQMIRLAASKLDRGDPEATAYCAMAKRFATDAGFNICNDALQLHGGYGYIREYPLERMIRDLRVHQILEGTNEIMRLVISRRMFADGVLEQMQ